MLKSANFSESHVPEYLEHGSMEFGAQGISTTDQSKPLKTGQTTSYVTGDDGDLELGISRSYTTHSTGQYSGTTEITINGKTRDMSNVCVQDNRTGLMWAREVPQADIGPAADGKLFCEQWTLEDKTDISFDNASGEIRSGAEEFNAGALCAGRKFTVTGTDSNDGTYTVDSIAAGAITTVEGVADEAAGDTVTIATVDDLIWDLVDQANANALGGYTDWRIPNRFELETILDLGEHEPCIDSTVFPSTPDNYHWTSSSRPGSTENAFVITFSFGYVFNDSRQKVKWYVRLVRG